MATLCSTTVLLLQNVSNQGTTNDPQNAQVIDERARFGEDVEKAKGVINAPLGDDVETTASISSMVEQARCKDEKQHSVC